MYENHSPLTINVISDLHYYSKKVGISGPDFDKANSKSQCDLKNAEEILEALMKQLEKDNDTDIVLVSGDITSNAEPASHEEVITLLRRLKQNGKRVYVITATHDYRDNNQTSAYTENGTIQIETAPREALWDMYYEFGPNEAISVHRESMSYVVQLADGYRLFALNDDKNNNGASGFSEDCFKWITEQVEDAHKNNQFIIAMTHHPLIPPSPFYKIIAGGNMMGEHEKRRNQFADMGIPFILTGHTHIQDISYTFSPNGNIFYDITTAAPVGFPGTYRKLNIDPSNDMIDVKAMEITEKPDFDIGDKTVRQHLSDKFFGMITELIDAAATDIPKLARMVTSFSVNPKLIY
ncbi:MAG: metallophosphoesterase, partial [Ruminococcus sp.]|nr:metallophosphoesterase [Ruminococcus sp.]